MTRRRRKSGRGSSIILLAIIALVAVVAFVTNPNVDSHRAAMNQRATIVMSEVVAEQNILVQGAWGLTGNRLLTEFVNTSVTADNYFLFSITKINWDNESYSVGVGAFGNVFIFRQINKELVEEIIEDARNNVFNTIPAFLRIILQ